jgi:hypothetical protein
MVDDAMISCITLAFASARVQRYVEQQHAESLVAFFMEKKDQPNPYKQPFIDINAKNNVCGMACFTRAVYQWAQETTAGREEPACQLHPTFLSRTCWTRTHRGDGFGEFQPRSIKETREHADHSQLRAADIYFTEFNRLFFHYFRPAQNHDQGNEEQKSKIR